MSSLIIVESPGKIKTIQKFLPKDFIVTASVGHVYQIKSDSDIDMKNNYKIKYRVCEGKAKVVKEIEELAKKADIIYLASDSDREGSAISRLIFDEIIKDKSKTKRITFTEITKSAVLNAIAHPKDVDDELDLFHAQQARSVLDLLVGFKVSPVLWAKVSSGTSAGRVQSIGLRLIVDRQREIDAFVPREYWTLTGMFDTQKKKQLKAVYHSEGDVPNETMAKKLEYYLKATTDWHVGSITKTSKSKSPYPVFNTSSLQQFASSSWGWDGKVTMGLAQKLYEGGYITYHRTDSLNISEEAITAVRGHIVKEFGKSYCAKVPRVFKSKNKVAQEAHEGIRASHLEESLEDVKKKLDDKLFKLYEAIYVRYVACQMADANLDSSKIIIKSKTSKNEFWATGQVIKFDGYLKLWSKFSSTKDEELPDVAEKDALKLADLKLEQHFTKPAAAFNTASLVKVLEEEGIGRPSTYASIVDTLLKRLYIEKDGKSFKPTLLGCKVSDFLVKQFPELMDKKYTARVEEQLDEIANGEKVWYKTVDDFYNELKKRIVESKVVESQKKGEATDILCPKCKKNNLVKREGRYGVFLGCSGYSLKDEEKCDGIFKIGEDGLPMEKKDVIYSEDKKCECGAKLIIRTGRKSGKSFLGCSKFPSCKKCYDMDGILLTFK